VQETINRKESEIEYLKFNPRSELNIIDFFMVHKV